MAAGEREQLGHAVRLQAPGDQAAAVQPSGLVVSWRPESIPPAGGSRRPRPLTARAARLASAARGKERPDGRTEHQITDADLDLLLREADRDDPILSDSRARTRGEPRESLD